MRMDKSQWPGCLLWHGWLLLLSGVNGESPWAVTADDAAVNMLESALGAYSSHIFQGWDFPQSVDWDSAADRMPPHPDVRTDGSLVRWFCFCWVWGLCSIGAFSASPWGLGRLVLVLVLMFGLMVVLVVTRFLALHLLGLGSMLACMLILGQTVDGDILMVLVSLQMAWLHLVEASALFLAPCILFSRAEFLGVILALQAPDAVHLGIDNLNVGRHVGRLLDGVPAPPSFKLDDDGDLIGLIRKMLCSRGEGTVCISKVKGHAEEEPVR